jgi:hypothetical protein
MVNPIIATNRSAFQRYHYCSREEYLGSGHFLLPGVCGDTRVANRKLPEACALLRRLMFRGNNEIFDRSFFDKDCGSQSETPGPDEVNVALCFTPLTRCTVICPTMPFDKAVLRTRVPSSFEVWRSKLINQLRLS